MIMVARESAQFVSTLEEHARRTFQKNGEEITIVVDAGHGGIDPGKIGVNNALEKDINLTIAQKLERNLRENGIHVVMTRTDDNGLYKENDTNKKVRDMKKRLNIISCPPIRITPTLVTRQRKYFVTGSVSRKTRSKLRIISKALIMVSLRSLTTIPTIKFCIGSA